ncbi:MAG TPA: hypothetical protein VF646_17800 [Cytophagales bacterium]
MTEKERMELVERILLNQIPEEEQPAVKRMLAEDEELQRELRFQLQLRQTVRKGQREHKRATLRAFDEAPAVPLWARAAVVVLVLAAGIAGWLLLRNPGRPGLAEGVVPLPLYETEDLGLGIGKEGTYRGTIPAVFTEGAPPTYEFTDTLKVSTPRLPPADAPGRVVYERPTDTYYLLLNEDRYEIVRGLRGFRPLRKAE